MRAADEVVGKRVAGNFNVVSDCRAVDCLENIGVLGNVSIGIYVSQPVDQPLSAAR